MRPLTDREFVRGYDCVRRAWLDRNRPDLEPVSDVGAKGRMDTGKRIGSLAHGRYPGGAPIPRAEGGPEAQWAQTRLAIGSGPGPFFGATMFGGGCSARLDVLRRYGEGWAIDEVKSSSKKEPARIKPIHVAEVAFQMRTAEAAGLSVVSASLILVDSRYVWDGGDYCPQGMLGAVDVKSKCDAIAPKVEEQVARQFEAFQRETLPDVETNRHCKDCDYFHVCHPDISSRSTFFLPGIKAKEVATLRQIGAETIDLIPVDYPLDGAQSRSRQATLTGSPSIDPGLGAAIAEIGFPAAFVDFETVSPGLPAFRGTRPYETVPFQWSAHTLATETSTAQHAWFLSDDAEDPRERFCSTLWDAVQSAESIVYYSDFEIRSLKALVAADIPLASELLGLFVGRGVDLMKVVEENVYLAEFLGSFSLKSVLPALVPSRNYDGLEVSDGEAASAAFLRSIAAHVPAQEAARLRQGLLDYCRLDTEALVEIYRALRALR